MHTTGRIPTGLTRTPHATRNALRALHFDAGRFDGPATLRFVSPAGEDFGLPDGAR